MSWLAQQRYVAWLVSGFIPIPLLTAPLAAAQSPATQSSFMTSVLRGPETDLAGSDPFQEDTVDVAPPAVSLPETKMATAPQPVSNPLPPAFWSALSLIGLLTLVLSLRRLKSF